MAGKWLSAVAGVLLLVGCMVGISLLVFQEETPKSSYKIRSDESLKGWEAGGNSGNLNVKQERSMGGTQLHGTLKAETELNMLADELDKLFTKSQSQAVGGLQTKRNLTHKISPPTPRPPPPPRLTTTEPNDPSTRLVNVTSTDGPKMRTPTWRDLSFQVGPHLSRRVFPTAGLEPLVLESSNGGAGVDRLSERNHEWEDMEMAGGEDAETSEEDQYVSDADEEPGDVMELDALFDLASNLYASGVNTSDFQGFLRVINETINRGNESSLLTQLNELYSRPELASALGSSDVAVGRNAYETSLTAFVFMSFGVFLLNQIHGLVGKENLDSRSEGRQFQLNALDNSELDLLFQPPAEPEPVAEGRNETGSAEQLSELSAEPTSPKYVNNMFRALLNLVNAYTKDAEVLECIWSLYCQDLDKTSATEGLYGIAARINSIGLRLIMHQISAELTMDVMLRSMLGWDGLPCTKMFPKCQVENATATLRAATSGNSPSPPTSLPI